MTLQWPRKDLGRRYPPRPVPPWSASHKEVEALERLERGRCKSCAYREHDCSGDCNCPKTECIDARRGRDSLTPVPDSITHESSVIREPPACEDCGEHHEGYADCPFVPGSDEAFR